MKKPFFFVLLAVSILTNCVSKKENEETITDIEAKVDSLTIWSQLLFKISDEEIENLKGNVKGHLTQYDKLGDQIEILLIGKDGTVLKKIKVDPKGGFAFNQLAKDDYFVILSHKNPTIKAELIATNDDSRLPEENELLERIYVLKHTLKKLKSDEFEKGGLSKIKVTLNAPNKKLLDNFVLMLVDEDNKVVRKVVSHGKSQFVFEKLPPGNYFVVMPNKSEGVSASIKVMKDDDVMVLNENAVLARAYVLKNALKKLKADDFGESTNTVQVTLKAPNKNIPDNTVLLVVDESNKVVRKVVSSDKNQFVFEKLPAGNYFIIMHNLPTGYTASVKMIDNDPNLLTENSSLSNTYVLKNTLKKLKADEFVGAAGTAEVTLKMLSQKTAKNNALLMVDASNKIVKKVLPNAKGLFVFENLARDDYALVLPNKPTGASAIVKFITSNQPASKTNKQKDFVIEMVEIPGGTLTMGSLQNKTGDDQYNVTLSNYRISKYEITLAQWKDIIGMRLNFTIGKKVSSNGEVKGNTDIVQNFAECNECPIENVSWTEAQEFIKKLNKRTGRNYALPTEAQWEYAARGGQAYTYAGSNNIDEVGWYKKNSDGQVHPVGQKNPNGYGLYDMTGNAEEWCMDTYDSYPKHAETNPTGPAEGNRKVIRGGSYSSSPRSNTFRTSNVASSQLGGFRLVLLP